MSLLAVNRARLLKAAAMIDETVGIPVKLSVEIKVHGDTIAIGGIKLSPLEALELAYRLIITAVQVERCREVK